MIRRLTPLQLIADIVFAVLFASIGALGAFNGNDAHAVIVLLVMAAALAVRRLSPWLALGLVWVGALLQMVLASPAPAYADAAVLGVLYCTALYGDRVLRWVGIASAGVGAVVAVLYLVVFPVIGEYTSGSAPEISDVVRSLAVSFFGLLAVLGLSWTLGLLVRTYRRARESRLAQSAAEHDVVVEQERNRIARDMHDVVAHSLAVVIAQADGARYAAKNDPGVVDAALGTIAATAREALSDVRVLLTQLRHNEDTGPQPVLGDLDRLVANMTDSGLEVQRTESGIRSTLPNGQQLALYRIVQEALTNSLRHGSPDHPVEFAIDWGDPTTLTISNALVGASTPGPAGHGLAGMRERANLVRGSVTAGAVDGRWVVRAELPVTE
jgi:signal transduction histidine kinase